MQTRRTFIHKLALTGAALPLFNIARGRESANGKINHVSFGTGGQAFSDILAIMKNGNVNLLAVAEVDERSATRFKEAYPEVRIYKDWRALLDKEGSQIDSVNVSTPDHMHAPMGMTAMEMGIHLYGQKPMAHTLLETRRMTELAKKKGLITQLGTQLTSSMYERLVARMIQDGVIGKVKEVYLFSNKTWGDPNPLPDRTDPVPPGLEWDLWLGVARNRPYINNYYAPGEWRKRLDFGTGTLGDMGCHIFSPPFQALGIRTPISVKSTGGTPNATNWAIDESLEYQFEGTELTAGDTLRMTWCDGSQRPPEDIVAMFGDKMPDQGGIFIGTDGVLLAPHGGIPKAYPLEKYSDYRYPKLAPRDHYNEFIAAVAGEKVKPLADFVDYGGALTEAVLLGGLASHFPGETLQWDSKNLRFTNSPKATAMVSKPYRDGWKIKGLES